MKYLLSMLLALLLMFSMTACGSADKAGNSEEELSAEETVLSEADPKAAIEEIYANFERTNGLRNATYKEVEDVMGFDLDTIEEHHIRYMETDYGASDVYIIKPKEGQEETVRQAMKDWQEARVRTFIGYDIYNSTSISENAVIFQRGDYLVMLMLDDNDSARISFLTRRLFTDLWRVFLPATTT